MHQNSNIFGVRIYSNRRNMLFIGGIPIGKMIIWFVKRKIVVVMGYMCSVIGWYWLVHTKSYNSMYFWYQDHHYHMLLEFGNDNGVLSILTILMQEYIYIHVILYYWTYYLTLIELRRALRISKIEKKMTDHPFTQNTLEQRLGQIGSITYNTKL